MKKRKSSAVRIQFKTCQKHSGSLLRVSGCFLMSFFALCGLLLTLLCLSPAALTMQELLRPDTNITIQNSISLPCLLILGIYSLLLLAGVCVKRKSFFLILLLLPTVFCFAFEKTPSFLSIGCFLAAFLCGDFAFSPDSVSYRKFFSISLLLGLYAVCVLFLTPVLSPSVFKPRQALYTKVNTFLEKISFSYESQTGKQTLSNTAPVYSSKTMFQFHSDSPLNNTVYLRGFIGSTYTDASWEAPEKSSWRGFLKENRLREDNIRELFSLPYTAFRSENYPAKNMSLTPKFSPDFTYLPYGSLVPSKQSANDRNELSGFSKGTTDFSCIPLTLDSASVLTAPAIPDSVKNAEAAYHAYAYQQYSSCSGDVRALFDKEISQLPVYSSMPRTPALSDIRNAEEEIRHFLQQHASYSLSLAPVSSDSDFLETFLYRQHRGFCVHFATAGTLLFRMYGIPARYVSGYVIFPEELSQDENGSYSCKVLDSSAHAWTEIYVGNGAWVPVEMTPGTYAGSPVTQDIPDTNQPNTDNIQPVPDKAPGADVNIDADADTAFREKSRISADTITKNPDETPSGGFLFLKKLLLILTVCTLFIIAVFLLLCLRRTIIFKKRMGYFARSRTDCCCILFNSILQLWKTEFQISPSVFANIKDEQFKELFKELLPMKEQTLFLKLYQETEQLYFSAEKPKKKRVRTYRQIYMRTRKKLLAGCSTYKKLYYIFILGI